MAEPEQQQDPDPNDARGESIQLAESIRQQLSELEERVTRIMNDENTSPVEQQEAKVIKSAFNQLWIRWKTDDDSVAVLVLMAFNLGRQVQYLDSVRQSD